MSEDIVVQLRGWSEGSSDDSCRMVWLMRQSADTIEALRGEVDLIKTLGVGAALETVAQKERAQKAEAEAARLKAALEALAGEVEQACGREQRALLQRDCATKESEAWREERDRLKAALQPFASIKADDGDTFDAYDDQTIIRCELTVGDLKAARKELAGSLQSPPQ